MKLVLKTDKLKEMVQRAVKGCSNNKMFPLTSLLGIELKNHKLTLTTTDMTNYVYIREENVDGEDFYVSVPADVFSKLVGNTTSDTITLNAQPSYLEVIGNGKYKINLVLDENGNVVRFPNYTENLIQDEIGTVHFTTIKVILNSLKPALATTLENPAYTNYFVGNSVVASDTQVINIMNNKLFSGIDKPLFISAELMNLLNVMTEENISVRYKDNVIEFVSDECIIHGELFDYTDDYQIDEIMAISEIPFSSSCKISRAAFLQLLDRIALFIGDYADGAIDLKFTKEGLMVESKAQLGAETIPYGESNNFRDFVASIEIRVLKAQVKAQSGDMLEIFYGQDNAIKFVDGNIISIIGLIVEAEEEEEAV